jgi:hypothetical protein
VPVVDPEGIFSGDLVSCQDEEGEGFLSEGFGSSDAFRWFIYQDETSCF